MLSEHPLAIPRFAAHWAAAVADDEALIVQSETRRVVLRGRTVVRLAQTMDGRRSVAELAELLAPEVSPIELGYVLDRLEQAGYLSDAHGSHAQESAFWAQLELPDAAAKLGDACVVLKSAGVDPAAARATLQQAGLACAADAAAAKGALNIVLCDDYLNPEVEALVEACDGPVLLAKLGGVQPMLGPLLAPSYGPCWHCLVHALKWNRPVQQFVQRQGGGAFPVPAPGSAAGMVAAAGMLAMAAARVLAGDTRLRHVLMTLDLGSLQTATHNVRQRPQCPHCGYPGWMKRQAEQAPELRRVRVPFQSDGGYRSCSPQQTLDTYRSLISPLTGVVNYLHPMPGRHGGSRKVYASGYQVCPQELSPHNGFDKICAGKGQSDEQAQASALCEALERASSVWQGDEAVLMASLESLAGEQAAPLSFDTLQGFSARQYAHRAEINAATTDRRRQVPLPQEADAVIAWTPAWSLGEAAPCMVPLGYCFAETPAHWGSAYGIYNPNGTAAGNCLEEAVLQGLLELIERDATAVWWYNRLARPELDLDVIEDSFIETMRREYTAGGWRLRVLDLTHDLGVAVYAAVAHHPQLDRYAIGFGCHLHSQLAVSRALTELNQLLDVRVQAPPPWDRSLLPRAEFLQPGRRTSCLPELACGIDLQQDIHTCLRRLAAAGLQAYVVNKTRPDIGLAVAQVIVPGLRHFWPRFGPGRLYEVPLIMGWQDHATEEDQLNPAPLFL